MNCDIRASYAGRSEPVNPVQIVRCTGPLLCPEEPEPPHPAVASAPAARSAASRREVFMSAFQE